MAKNFWFKFYFKDWADDVKPLSLNARGLLIELIIHLNKVGGIMECKVSDIIRLTGGLTEEISGGLDEFRKNGTFDFEIVDGIEFLKSRKILKQIEIQSVNSENGKKGGNPNLKGLTGSVKRKANRTPNSNSISSIDILTHRDRFLQDSNAKEQAFKFIKALGKPMTMEKIIDLSEAHDAQFTLSHKEGDYTKWCQYFCYFLDGRKPVQDKKKQGLTR
jgi:hypothetical protein